MSGRNFGMDAQQYWDRDKWWLSRSVRKVFGTFYMTLGLFVGTNSTSASQSILIMPNVNNKKEQHRLPTGLSISVKQYPDFKRAFAVFMMNYESLSLDEAAFRLGLKPDDLSENSTTFADQKNDNFEEPKRNGRSVAKSRSRVQALRKALQEWEELNPEPEPVNTSLADEEEALLEQEVLPQKPKPTINLGDDDDTIDDDSNEDATDSMPPPQQPAKKAKMAKKSK